MKVRIPAGVGHGMYIQLAGEGEVGPSGGTHADLFLEIIELEDPIFKRVDDNLYRTISIFRSDLTNETISVDALDGPKTVRIPAGVKQGTRVRIPGAGVANVDDNSIRGDLFVDIDFAD
jgi:molecular chaperone DnaJ